MDAALITKIEKSVDRSASALFGLACGYGAYAWFAGRTPEPVLGLGAAAASVLGYLLSLRGLGSIQPEPRKVPVPIFDVREVEPMVPIERPVLERVRPAAERPIPEEAEPVAEHPDLEPVAEVAPGMDIEPVADTPVAVEEFVEPESIEPAPATEAFGAADSTELELTDRAEPEVETPVVPFASDAHSDEEPQDSRVVHLFDPASMPTPEEMISRIDRHFESQPSAAQSADAAQALHEALAELRRSIR
jgi:hypothetical protein